VYILPKVYFAPTAGGEVRIFGFYTNEQTNKNFRALPRELDGAMQSFKNAVLNAALAYTSYQVISLSRQQPSLAFGRRHNFLGAIHRIK